MEAGVLTRHAMTQLVVTVRPDDSLAQALRILQEEVISGLPVVNLEGRLVGVLSEKDIVRVLPPGTEPSGGDTTARPMRGSDIPWSRLSGIPVREAMNHDPIVIGPETTLDCAREIMAEHQIRRLPVVDHGRLIGILSAHDLQAAMPAGGKEVPSSPPLFPRHPR